MSCFNASAVYILLILVLAGTSSARKFVVPHDAPTIKAAVDGADQGDTVFVTSGTYRESITLSDGIVLMGQDVDKTIMRGDRRRPVITVARNAVITNLTIENGATGILCENASATIEHNFIRNNARTGIQCIINLPQIRNNVIAGNQWSGIFCELISRAGNASVEHNIIADNGYSGVMLSNRSVVLIQNNIIFRNKEYGIFVSENARRSRIIFNSFYENRMAFNQYAVIDETNISKDPALPPLAGANYSAISSIDSPLRGMGKDGTQIGLTGSAAPGVSAADRDKDGIPDGADQCPDGAEDADKFDDGDGCPDYDNDFDGMYDQFDRCPDKREDFDGFEDTDGCPDDDNDADGVLDALDKCPNKPETINQFKDNDGCPDQPEKQ